MVSTGTCAEDTGEVSLSLLHGVMVNCCCPVHRSCQRGSSQVKITFLAADVDILACWVNLTEQEKDSGAEITGEISTGATEGP